MNWLTSDRVQLLERFLDVAASRQSLVSANIANVDTPGYHTRDIDFRGELQKALQDDDLAPTAPMSREVRGLIARPDGNNVSVDREGLLLSEVQLQFNIATQLIKAEFKKLSTAIHEGSGS